jgi:hypothetical protein
MMDSGKPLRYRDADGQGHELLVREAEADDWQVLDRSGAGARVIETLDGREDGPEQALAIARDFLQTRGRSALDAGRAPCQRIPEGRGADDHSDRRPHKRAHEPQAGPAALPVAAR